MFELLSKSFLTVSAKKVPMISMHLMLNGREKNDLMNCSLKVPPSLTGVLK